VRESANPHGKDKSDNQINESRDDQLQNSRSFLTIGEEKCVCQWIIDRQHKRQGPSSVEAREFASALQSEPTHSDLAPRKRPLSFKGVHNKSCLQERERPQSREPSGNDQSVRTAIEIAFFDNEQGHNQGSGFATAVK
jgi:hypothetical protein